MIGIRFLFVNLVVLFNGVSSAERCDRATTAQVREGIIGQSGDFNWLGVLHVHLHDEKKIQVAMTGIVLIKLKHALAHADDIVRIPQTIFKSDSKAMFFPAKDTPWIVKPASYITHPEYEYSTLNTIAIIELDLDGVDDFPLNPICLPSGEAFNTSRYLYLTGFTDENRKLEKVIYNIQYLDKKVCEEFYNRAGLSSPKRVPAAYVCGYARSNLTQCVWDSGMALVSNVSGYFHLIGFGTHGPGCAAPARFIDLFPYFHWMHSVLSPDEVYDYDGNFRRQEDDGFIPVHQLFKINDSLRKSIVRQDFKRYPFEKGDMQYHIILPSQDEKSTLNYSFNDTWEKFPDACNIASKVQIYKEFFQLSSTGGMMRVTTYKLSLYDKHDAAVLNCVRLTEIFAAVDQSTSPDDAPRRGETCFECVQIYYENLEVNAGDNTRAATYKLSLYDTHYSKCVYVRLTVDCDSRSDAVHSFKEKINFKENIQLDANPGDGTPEELFKYYRYLKDAEETVPNLIQT